MSRPGGSGKLLAKNAHLWFVVERARTTCMICHELMEHGEPLCERCGLGAFHLSCYTETIAGAPKERSGHRRRPTSPTP